MDSKLMFLAVCMIGCAVSCIKADNLPTPTNLTSNITRNECGKTKLCLDNPKGCDPSGSSQCYFTSATLSNINITVELSGNSAGYIALAAGVTSDVFQASDFIFVCGNNSDVFFFQTTKFSNNRLEMTDKTTVSSIQGSIEPSLIQCVFSIPIEGNTTWFLRNVTNFNNSNTANSPIPIFLDILKGSTNGTALGAPTSVLGSSALVNLANVSSTNVVSTSSATASTTPSTTAGTTPSTTASTTPSTTASTTPSTTASTTPSTTASTTPSTTAGTTPSTTAGTIATTKANSTAKSNASISLISLFSHAAICLLSILLHLI